MVDSQIRELLNRGNTAFCRHDYEEAQVLYDNAISVYGKRGSEAAIDDKLMAFVHSNLSGALLFLNQNENALSHADRALQLWPEYVKSHGRRGAALLALGQTAESVQSYENGLKLSSAHQGILSGLDFARAQHRKVRPGGPATNVGSGRIEEGCTGGSKGGDEGVDVAAFVREIEDSEFVAKSTGLDVEEVVKVGETSGKGGRDEMYTLSKKDFTVVGTAGEELDRLTQKNFKWLNLNPFLVLNLPTTATGEDIKQRYRQLSTLVHPDKCRDDRSREAFEEVDRAYHELNDEKRRENVVELIKMVRQSVIDDMKRTFGKSYMSRREEVDEAIRLETIKCFAENEKKRRDIQDKRQSYRKREGDKKAEEKKKLREGRQVERAWQKGMDNRVGNWRNYKKQKTS